LSFLALFTNSIYLGKAFIQTSKAFEQRRVAMRAHLSKAIGAVSLSLVLAACGQSAICSSEKEAAEYLAKLAADVQSATTGNKLSMDQLKLLTRDVDTAGTRYTAKKDPAEFCKDLEKVREDYGLAR
jgi:hypothetical protein